MADALFRARAGPFPSRRTYSNGTPPVSKPLSASPVPSFEPSSITISSMLRAPRSCLSTERMHFCASSLLLWVGTMIE